MKKLIYFLFSVFLFFKSSAQTIAPFILNNGGGHSSNLEWSLNESVSVANFNNSSYSLSTGVLQTAGDDIKNNIESYNASLYKMITIGPNPTSNLLNIKIKYFGIGDVSIQLINLKGSIVLTHQVGTIYATFEKSISLAMLSSATYFLKIQFKPLNQISKTAVYKIVKL